jgi:hypothetical protein
LHVAGEPTRNGPHGPRVEQIEELCVGHEARDAAVAVQERVRPQPAMMRRGCGENAFGLTEPAIDKRKAIQEAGHRARTYRHMEPNFHVSPPDFAGHDFHSFAHRRIFHPQQVFRKQLAEAPVDLADALAADGASGCQTTLVDPLLNHNMGARLKLQIAFARILAVVFS